MEQRACSAGSIFQLGLQFGHFDFQSRDSVAEITMGIGCIFEVCSSFFLEIFQITGEISAQLSQLIVQKIP